jgi:hypothetical protein
MPSTFRTPLDARLIAPDTWQLLAPFEFRLGSLQSPYVIGVEVGFVTDLTSIPWFMRWLFSPAGRYAKAAVIHDMLYQRGLCSRLVADAIMWEGMLALDLLIVYDQVLPRQWLQAAGRALARTLIYSGLRLGGWWTWRSYRRREVPMELA